MGIIFYVTALFGIIMFGWGAVDTMHAMDTSGIGSGYASSMFAYAAAGKATSGVLILVLSVGFDAILSMGREIIRRHPGVGPGTTMMDRLLPPSTGGQGLPGALDTLTDWE